MTCRMAKIAGLVLIIWASVSGIATAGEGEPAPARVKVCTEGEVVTCKTATLPKKAGHVRNIIRGN